ncbi:helix-turn-helix domain-containing protein [Streptomyces wuyuanensis]|uniref:helix-turn-helix domain-containing protein n=1 Tax=Streptomyces wuyuanensis TaxID=1196353 RepID=UPI0037B8424C
MTFTKKSELSVMDRDIPVSQDDTISMLLKDSKRHGRAVPIRRAFVQDTEPGPVLRQKPGPLPKLLRSPAAFDLYLLIHAITAGGDFGVTQRYETWGRATGISFATNGSASAAVSRQLAKLKQLKLISTTADGRKTRITKRLEDGSEDPYTVPSGGSRKDIYFKLPFEYWEQGLHNALSMPAKGMLLIAMSLRKRAFALPQNKDFAKWYGISPATVSRGIADLKKTGLLLEYMTEAFLTGESPTGRAERTLYVLKPPYNINIKKTDREAEERALTPEGILATALSHAKHLGPPRLVFTQPEA